MRIDVIYLISGVSKKVLERRREMLQRCASPGTDVRLVKTSRSPASVESFAEMELAARGILERVVQSEREGADAIVVWGGHDPSLVAARELVTIPVIGPGMASMYIAAISAEKFSLLVQLPHAVSISKRQLRDYGLESRCTSIRSVDVPVLELLKPEFFDAVRDIAIRSIEEDGADAICFGCMAFSDHVSQLSEALAKSHPGVVVVHPGKAALRLAELLVDMGISHSKRSYPHPPKPILFNE